MSKKYDLINRTEEDVLLLFLPLREHGGGDAETPLWAALSQRLRHALCVRVVPRDVSEIEMYIRVFVNVLTSGQLRKREQTQPLAHSRPLPVHAVLATPATVTPDQRVLCRRLCPFASV